MEALKPFHAVLFDMDGVILDTEPVHIAGWYKAFQHFNKPVEESFLIQMRGSNWQHQEKVYRAKYGSTADYWEMRKFRAAYVQDYFDHHGIQVKRGYREITEWLKERHIPRALCTSTALKTVEHEFPLAGLRLDFDAMVTGNEPEHGKPAPDTFLLGAQRLRVKPEDCIVFEDSPNGIQAGNAAGCQVIMIPDTVPADEKLRSLSSAVCSSLLDAIPLLEASYQG